VQGYQSTPEDSDIQSFNLSQTVPNRRGISCLPWGLLAFDRGITEPGMDRRTRPWLARRSEELIVADDDMVIVRDSVSGDWLVEDYAREAVLFRMPRDCSSDEVRRAAALYVAAFKSGFEQGRFVARSMSSLG
jgi:hypothetical protein